MYGKVHDFHDQEYPGLVAEKFDKAVKKQYKKEQIPEVKPKEIFKDFKDKKKKKNKKTK